MAFMEPQSLRPLPRYYYSPTYRGAATGVRGEPVDTLYKTRKMEGTLGGVFNVLLAGERVSGTFLYGARKKLGFGEIGWIEQAERGAYKRISPSEALGIRGYDDKFWTARGITSLALDIALDPTTYLTLGMGGLAKIGVKGGVTVAGKTLMTRGGIRVGAAGKQFVSETMARGISRGTAERKLIEYMWRSPAIQAEMAARGGVSALRFMGRPLMETARITEPAGRLWRAAPMLETRALIAEDLRTKFQVFHRLKRQVGEWATKPYEEYYRATGVGRTRWDKEIALMAKGAPTEWHEQMVRFIERGETPATNAAEIISLANRYQRETSRMAREEVAAGILDPAIIRQMYYARMPTEEAMRYTERKMGKMPGITREETVSQYIRTLGAAHQRAIKGDIFEAERYMTSLTGVKQWYVMDPFESLQRRGVSSIMSLESRRLWGAITEQMGIRAVPEIVTRYAEPPLGKRLPSLIKGYRLTHQERALQSLRDIVAAGGDVEKINLPHALQELKGGRVFGKVRPEGKTPWTWMRERFEEPISEYHRYKREIWELGKEETTFEQQITRELRRRVISRKDIVGFERSIALTRRGIRHREERIATITTGLRVEGGAIGRELIDPVERAVLKYRTAYEADIGKIPGRRLITKEISPEKQMWKDDVFYRLKGGYYVPSEALTEYTRRIPTTGWWSRLETRFKKTLTSIWPAFHARNLYGMALWQNVLAGVDPRAYAMNIDVMRKTSPWMAKHAAWARGDVGKLYDIPFMGKKTAAQLRDIGEEAEVYGITGMVDVAATYTTKGKGIMRKLSRVYEQYPQEAMVGIESFGRGSLFWNRVLSGMPIESAMKDVEKFHFRYGQGGMTQFETDYMRHGFLFYRWMRGNIPLQAQMSLEKPYMYAGLGKLSARGIAPEERSRLQDWQRERFGFTAGNTFVSLDLPFYEHPALFLNPSNWEDIYFAMTPAVKFPVGIFAGRDPATGAPIEDWGARGRYAMSQFMGRGVYAQRELYKTWTGERPLSWTAIHQLGGLGVYEMAAAPMYKGMTSMPRVPSALKKMGVSEEKWTEYQMARGWTPRLTDVSRAEIYQQHGGVCSVCGQPCSPAHPCSSQLIVPPELGGTYTPENTALVCSSCSGTFRRNIAPMMRASQTGLQVPTEYRTGFTDGDRDRIYGVIDSYMSDASLVE